MINKIWSVLLVASGIIWLVDAVRVVFDTSYHPDKFALVVAFVITGTVVLKGAAEVWYAE